MTPNDPLEACYDEPTLSRIDRSRRSATNGAGATWRSASVAGAIAGASFTGVADAIGAADEVDGVHDVWPEPVDVRLEAVTIHFVPHDPQATVAVIRPWLLDAAR